MNRFWIVVALDNTTTLYYKGSSYGWLKQTSHEVATKEAQRLTHKFQKPFGVMELIEGFQVPTPEVEKVILS